MPKLNDDEIKTLIADGTIAGITLDTSVFDRYGCNLQFVSLGKLDQFKGGAIGVFFPQIVVSEVLNHIARDSEEAHVKLRAALREHKEKWKSNININELLHTFSSSLDSISNAKVQFDNYIQRTGAIILPATGHISVDQEVILRYFSSKPPFEKRDAKKNEFPDAFALLSLEKYFESTGKILLCISADKGWQNFAEESRSLICVDELDRALSLFNESGRNVADQALALLKAGNANEFVSAIELAVQARLDDLDFNPECYNGLDYDAEPENASLQYVKLDSISSPIVIEATKDEVTFTFNFEALVEFEAVFDFQVYDSIDGDYVHLSTEDAVVEKSLSFNVVVTVSRELAPEPQILEANVKKDYFDVDFGHVDPFPNENPEHEKY